MEYTLDHCPVFWDHLIALSAEPNIDRLMEQILVGAKELTHSDGGTLYIAREDGRLGFEIIQNDTLNIKMGGTAGERPAFEPVPLKIPKTGEENHANVVSHAVLEKKTINIPNAYESMDFDFTGTRSFDAKTGYRSKSFLTVPLVPRGGDVIGALQLINATDPATGEIIEFDEDIVPLVEALAAQAAIALDNRNLILAQRHLMDSMIQLIAGAIDTKSPYTGGHCERVPELAVMLAEAATESDAEPFHDFGFTTEDEWREYRIGAWLHDCGKVTTPEYVVDKATKLETIYDRVHEVRMRFEVLLRDASIKYYQDILAGGDAEALKAQVNETYQKLQDDYAFVAECNVGGEFMHDEAIERINEIAKTKWMRHFDDRIGISHSESERKERTPAETLPAEEFLLSNRDDHIVHRRKGDGEFDPAYGFEMEVPEHLYNLGEIYNLSIRRGTLTEEERYKINEHIIQTVIMLENMPFPKHLNRVPEYAVAHHETMIGTGYPRKLKKDQMSLGARIMAIADIFEALTAADRPYKKAKTLSESIRILSFFKKDEHIDGDLFDLFLTSGIYKKYADRFLEPHQIDEVDINDYLEEKIVPLRPGNQAAE